MRFNLQAGLHVMIDEYGRATCNCPDSVMEYSKANQKCSCPGGGHYTEDLASYLTFIAQTYNNVEHFNSGLRYGF